MAVQTISGVNPLDPEALEKAKTMAAKAEQVKRENAPPENLVEPRDLTDSDTIAGFECVRPMSAGLFAVLQIIKHPFVTGGESKDEFVDSLVVLYLLLSDTSERKIVNLARLGAESLADAAIEWSFKLTPADMGQLMNGLPAFMEKFSEAMEVYGGADSSDKKK